MIRDVVLLDYWIPELRRLKEFQEIAKAEEPELVSALTAIERMRSNMFIETADEYGISRFERICGIYPENGDTLESRKSRVLLLYNTLPYTYKVLINKLIELCGVNNLDIWSNFKTGYELKINTTLALFGQMESLNKILDDMIPANIVVEVKNNISYDLIANVNYCMVIFFIPTYTNKNIALYDLKSNINYCMVNVFMPIFINERNDENG